MFQWIERTAALVAGLGTVALAASCINVNISFPRVEIEEGADRIVNEVRQEPELQPPQVPPAGKETSGAAPAGLRSARKMRGTLIAFPVQEKKDEKKIDTSENDAVVKKIVEGMKKRNPQLVPFFDKKALGENRQGYVDARSEDKLNLEEKKTLRKLIEAENKDRKNLYLRIAEINKVEADQLKDIQAIYASKWIEKAKKGWWVQDEKNKWIEKP